MQTYAEANAYLGSKQDRPTTTGKHTRVQRRPDGSIAVKYHETDVVTYQPDGTIVLDTGGWKTATTKQRLNEYSPLSIWQSRGVWYAANDLPMSRRATISPDGTVTTDTPNVQESKKLRQKVHAYAKAFVKALEAGKVEAPGGGDCWGCLMKDQDGKPIMGTDHLLDHMEESYFVPSLVVNALEALPSSITMKSWVAGCFQRNKDAMRWSEADRVKKVIARYMLRELGEVA